MHVTVVISTSDRAALLSGGVEAALAQTHRDLDVLVIDDGSTDRTAERLARFRDDPRVAWVRLAQNRGSAAAKNLGLLLARGDAVGFHACDDIPARDKVASQLDALRRRSPAPAGYATRRRPAATMLPDAALTGHVAIGCDGAERVALRPDWPKGAGERPAPGDRPLIDAGLFRREVFERLGGFSGGMDEVSDLCARIRASGGSVAFVPRPLLTRFERPVLQPAPTPAAAGVARTGSGAGHGEPARRVRGASAPILLANLAVADVHSQRPLQINPEVPVFGYHPSLARFGLLQAPQPATASA